MAYSLLIVKAACGTLIPEHSSKSNQEGHQQDGFSETLNFQEPWQGSNSKDEKNGAPVGHHCHSGVLPSENKSDWFAM